jgi:uncharacterized protein with PQ loop repeat
MSALPSLLTPSLLLTAWILFELSYLPQLARVARRRSAEDFSLTVMVANVIGRLAALLYAIEVQSSPFAAALIVGTILHATLLLQVAAFRALPKREPVALP